MTKEGLINAVISKTGLSAVDNVQLIGFGTFSVDERAAREGRNPATGEKMQIPAKKVAKWKPSKGLID